jgi:DNA-binding transcriptional MerR regulator
MLKTHNIKEVSRLINVPLGTIKKWEKELSEFLVIPRTKGGARYYTNSEIELLIEIKQMRSKNQKIDLIRDNLTIKSIESKPVETSVEIVTGHTTAPTPVEESPMMNVEVFFNAMETYKQNVIQEVKEEIRSVVRKEIVEEMKKEISKGTLQTVKCLTDSIYKSTEKTKAGIQDLSFAVNEVSEQTKITADTLADKITKASIMTSEDLSTLSYSIGIASKGASKEITSLEKTIINITRGTSDQISTLSRQLSRTADDLTHNLDDTNNDIYGLKEAIANERENNIRDREQLRDEILQREAEFQNMLTAYRDAAASKEKRWWQFW